MRFVNNDIKKEYISNEVFRIMNKINCVHGLKSCIM